MFEETPAPPAENEIFEFTTALQPLELDPPHPFNPHIGEFSEQIYVLVCEMRRVKDTSK